MDIARAGFFVRPKYVRTYVNAITIALKRMGVKPEGEKIFSALSIPCKSAAMEITTRYGNIILVRTVASVRASRDSFPKKILRMSGVKIMPRVTKTTVKKVTRVKVAFMNSWVSLLPSSVDESSSLDLKVGIKATDTEFSAKSLRKKFGT